MKIVGLFTCYNRVDKTIRAISGVVDGNPGVFSFVAVDAGSTDGSRTVFQDVPDVTVI